MIVVDASTWVDYLTGSLAEDDTSQILSGDPASPPHVDFEVGSALLRLERRALLPPGSAKNLASFFSQLPLRRERSVQDQVQAYDLLDNATYADAIYTALATRLGSPLLTSDAGMVESARIAGVDVRDTSNTAP